MDIIRRIGGLMKPYRGKIAFALTLQLVVRLAHLLEPYITAMVVNDVITAGVYDMLLPLCGALIGLAITRGTANFIRGMTLERVSQSVVFDLRTGLYKHMQEMPYGFYDHHRVGEIMSRMTGDIDGVRGLIAGGLITVFDNSICFVGSLIFMLFMSWEITLMLLIMCPILAVLAWNFNKRIRPIFRSIREQNAVLNTRAQENLSGMRVVKAFAREDYESERFREDNRELLKRNLNATWTWSGFVPMMELLSGFCTPVALIGGAILVANDAINVGEFVGVTGYIWMLTNPMRQLSNIINMIANAITSAEKLFYYIDFGASIREPENARTPEKYEGHVEFDHVTFSYGDGVVLKDITFEAKPGQTIAVMGATGSGKSTLVTLLGRYYDIQKGSIKIDGIDVREHSLKPLRSRIGYVAQETFLFSDTLEDNIRFGRPDEGMDKVKQAANVAQATEFIEHMPAGYDTIVGERGLGLSGGQKQRVAIARAVLINPSILVLDDSTSAVDMETEYEIQQQLKEVLKNRTTFVIAHRISSVKNADQILILDKGEIVERGTHKELLQQKGIYYRMVMDQMTSAVGTNAAGAATV